MHFGVSVPGNTKARSCSRSIDGPFELERSASPISRMLDRTTVEPALGSASRDWRT